MSRYSNKLIHGKKNEPEEKWFDLDDDKPLAKALGTPNDYNLFLLNGIQAGTEVNQRIGSLVVMNYLRIDIGLYPTDYIPGTTWDLLMMNGRIALVYDRQVNGTVGGAQPSWQDFFQDWEADGSSGAVTWSNLNLNNRGRFKILWDEKFVLPGISKNANDLIQSKVFEDSKRTEVFKKTLFMNCETIFNQLTEGDLNDINTGALYLVARTGPYVGKVHAGPDIDWPADETAWNIAIHTRLRYADM